MRIDLVGKMALSKVNKNIKEVVEEIVEKANLPKDLKYKVQDVTCLVVFDIEGEEKALTVNHGGLQEVFNVKCALDGKGKIDKTVNNSKESFVDDYTRSVITKTEPKEYTDVIESEYFDEDLCELSTLAVDDKKEIVYKHTKDMTYVLRYYVGDNLVGELTTKEIPQEHLTNMLTPQE